MDGHRILVSAEWDPEAGVYVAESHDVPGLATEATTPDKLLAKLQVMVPELLALNGTPFAPGAAEFSLEVIYRTFSTVRIHA